METGSGMYYGHKDTTIAEVLESFFDQLPLFQRVAVRCLDSDSDPRAIYEVLLRHAIDGRLESHSVSLTSTQLRHAAANHVFTGFDELWFSQSEKRIDAIPSDIVLTSDAVNFSERIPEGLGTTMKNLASILVLGDGCGLNYATWDSRFSELLCELGL
jgi:hypothetical protein